MDVSSAPFSGPLYLVGDIYSQIRDETQILAKGKKATKHAKEVS